MISLFGFQLYTPVEVEKINLLNRYMTAETVKHLDIITKLEELNRQLIKLNDELTKEKK